MKAVLTYRDGKTREIEVPSPAPATWMMAGEFDIHATFEPTENGEAAEPNAIRFTLAGTESGVAEYFEEGIPDEPFAYYKEQQSYLENKARMDDVVKDFIKDYPDCKKYEEQISELGRKMHPNDGEDPYTFLKRVYDTYMEVRASQAAYAQKVAAQKQQAAQQAALQAQEQANHAQEMIQNLQQMYSPMMGGYANQTNVAPTQFGYQEGYTSSPQGLGGIVQAEMPKASPEAKISEVEVLKARMIKLKKD